MRLAFLVLTFALSSGASAQASFGLRAGLAVADINGFPGSGVRVDETPRLGPTVAVFAQMPVATGFAVQPEVAYVPRGVDRALPVVSAKSGDILVAERFRADYLDTAVLARIVLPLGETADAGVVLGPALAVKLSETITQEFEGGSESEIDRSEDFFSSTDIGLVIGADFGSGPFFVDARYTFGVTNVYNGESLNPTGGITDQDLQHGVFAATFGLRFGGE